MTFKGLTAPPLSNESPIGLVLYIKAHGLLLITSLTKTKGPERENEEETYGPSQKQKVPKKKTKKMR
jgi:hypothetical protein